MMSSQESEFGRFFRGWSIADLTKIIEKNIIKYMTHIYIPKSSDMWCIHHYGSTEVNMHLDFLGPVTYNMRERSKSSCILISQYVGESGA